MSAAPGLAQLQHWMQQVLIHPAGAGAGMSTEEARRYVDLAPEDLAELLPPSATLGPLERIGIYARMYKDRLVQAVGLDYTGVAKLVGEERFEQLLRAYIHERPSQFRSLNDYGRDLPTFLESRSHELPHGPLTVELARMESLLQDVLVEDEDAPCEDEGAFERLATEPDRHGLRVIRAQRVARFAHPVHRLLERDAPDSTAVAAATEPTVLLLHRFRERATWIELSPEAAAVFEALESGLSLQGALERGLECAPDGEALLRDVGTWFGQWRSRGLFAEVVSK